MGRCVLPSIQINSNKVGSRDRSVSAMWVPFVYYINFNIYGKISTSHVAYTHTHTHSGHRAHMVRKTANATERARESKRWHLLYDVLSVVIVVFAAAVVTFCFHRSFCRRMTSWAAVGVTQIKALTSACAAAAVHSLVKNTTFISM